ncbi:MAG: hypothetical protein R2911_31445 [Caldilineaceae bacterium]
MPRPGVRRCRRTTSSAAASCGQSAIGGGNLPGETLPTYVLALSAEENLLPPGLVTKWAAKLRQQPARDLPHSG